MKIESISLQNYGVFHGPHNFKLDGRGLVLVMGENLDEPRMKSNGAGKSTVFDALDWCLFGDIPRGDHVDSIVNEDAGSNTKVQVHLIDDNGQQVTVARWRGVKGAQTIKPNGCALFFGPNDHTALDDAETQNLIERALGLDREVFHALVLHAQTDTWNFANGSDAERIAILTKVLQLGQIDEWLERAKDRAQGLTADVQHAEGALASLQAKATELVNLNFRQKAAEWIEQHAIEVEEAKRSLAMAARDYDTAQRAVGNRAELEKMIADLRAREPVRPASPPAPVRPARPPAPAVPARPAMPAAPDTSEQRRQLDTAASTIQNVRAEIIAKRREVAALVHEADTFAQKNQGVCGECRQPINPEHVGQEVHRLRNKAQAIDLQAAALEQQSLKQWLDYEVGVQAHVKNLEAQHAQAVSVWQAELTRLDELHRQQLQQHAEALRQLDLEYEGVLAQHRQAVGSIEQAFAKTYAKYTEDLSWANHQLHDLAGRERLAAQAREMAEKARIRFEQANVAVNPWIKEQEELDKRIDKLRADIFEAGGRVQDAKLKLRYAEFWIQAFGPKGLKSFILDARVQELTDAANHWMRLIFGGTSWLRFETQAMGRSTGKLSNKFNIRCFRYMPDGSVRERNFKSLSGGEKQRTSLAIDMGLSRIIASRANKRYDLLVLDEVFKHLDSAGREAVIDLLHQLAVEKSSIFVVDHDAEFQGAFEHKVTVRKQGGRSIILEEGIGSANDQEVAGGASAKVGEEVQKAVPRRRSVSRQAATRR